MPALAGDPWNAAEKDLGISLATAYVLDWGQTRYIAKHPEKFREGNPVLGPHPSLSRVDNYFIAMGLVGYWIADALPRRYRKLLLYSALTVENGCVRHNQLVGVKLAF